MKTSKTKPETIKCDTCGGNVYPTRWEHHKTWCKKNKSGYDLVIGQRNLLLHACKKARKAVLRYTLDTDLIKLLDEAISYGEIKD